MRLSGSAGTADGSLPCSDDAEAASLDDIALAEAAAAEAAMQAAWDDAMPADPEVLAPRLDRSERCIATNFDDSDASAESEGDW